MRELAHQMQVELLVKLSQAPSTLLKPALLRRALEEGLLEFPTNTLLLSIYGWSEGRYRMEGRIRRFLNEHSSRYACMCLMS
jgi:hypothetical protein